MAASNLAATLVQNYRKGYDSRLDKHEQRRPIAGALELAKAQSSGPDAVVDPEIAQAALRNFGRNIEIPVIKAKNVTISNARSCTMPTGGIESDLVTLTRFTYGFGFQMIPSQHHNNQIAYETAFNKNFEAGVFELRRTLESGVLNLLETNKNQYAPAAITGFYAEDADTLLVPQADADDLYNQLGSVLRTQEFSGMPSIVANPRHMARVRRLGAQGAGNSVNEQFQFAGYNWYESNLLASRAQTTETTPRAVAETIYSVLPGSIGLVSAIDPDAARGEVAGAKEWGSVVDPVNGMQLGVFYQADCGDASTEQAGSGMGWATRVKKEGFEFSVDVIYVSVHNSAPLTRYNPIQKIEILS